MKKIVTFVDFEFGWIKADTRAYILSHHNGTFRVDHTKTNLMGKKRTYVLCSVVVAIGLIVSLLMIVGVTFEGRLNPASDKQPTTSYDPRDMGEVKGKVISHNTLPS